MNVKESMNTANELMTKHTQLRKAFTSTEHELDRNYSDELAQRFEAQFDELVAHEAAMIVAGIPC